VTGEQFADETTIPLLRRYRSRAHSSSSGSRN
jgi:hypothetical protein